MTVAAGGLSCGEPGAKSACPASKDGREVRYKPALSRSENLATSMC
jgi:hypothetical protein